MCPVWVPYLFAVNLLHPWVSVWTVTPEEVEYTVSAQLEGSVLLFMSRKNTDNSATFHSSDKSFGQSAEVISPKSEKWRLMLWRGIIGNCFFLRIVQYYIFKKNNRKEHFRNPLHFPQTTFAGSGIQPFITSLLVRWGETPPPPPPLWLFVNQSLVVGGGERGLGHWGFELVTQRDNYPKTILFFSRLLCPEGMNVASEYLPDGACVNVIAS